MEITEKRELKNGKTPAWSDLSRGYARRHVVYPLPLIEAINAARDGGVPASEVKKAIEQLIEQQQAE